MDDQDRTGCVVDDLSRDRAQVQTGKSAKPAGAHDDKIRLLGSVEYH